MQHESLTEIELINKFADTLSLTQSPSKHFYNHLGELKPASVLVPLLKKADIHQNYQWHILYTKRTDSVADHKSQVAFPGGQVDPSDLSLVRTALREAEEEIGVKSEDICVIGQLMALKTITNYWVTPIVGIIHWPYPFRIHSQEVSHIFTIPINWLANKANYEYRSRELPFSHHENRAIQVVYYKPYQGEILWGVSAEITLHLLTKLGFD